MTRIFISHSHSDEAIASKLVNFLMVALSLEEKEILCTSNPDQGLIFIPTGIIEQLKKHLKNSEALIILITADSLHSAWIPFEVGAFWTTDKKIIPILGPGLKHDDLPGLLTGFLSISIEAQDWEDQLNAATNQLADQLNIQQKVTRKRNETLREFSDSLRAWKSKRPATHLPQHGECILPYAQSQSPDFFKKVADLIPKTQKITLIGTGLNIIWQQKIVDLLIQHATKNNEVSITICLANPFSPHVEDRLTEEEMSGVTAPVGQKGIINIINNIWNLIERLEKNGNPDNFKVRLFENYPTLATLIFDQDIFIYPYTYQTLGTISPIVQLRNNGSPATNFFISNAKKIINDAIPVEDFVKIYHNPRYYSQKWIAAAVYLIPEIDQPFYQFGSVILGYDIWTNKSIEDKNIYTKRQIEDETIKNRAYVGEAANFGFHATIGDALYFVNEAEIDRIKAELEMLTNKLPPFTLEELSIVDRYKEEGDIVVACKDKTGVSEALHSELIHRFYRPAISSTYRAGQTEKLSRVIKSERRINSTRAGLMINKYGSPYILKEFNLHFTLCTSPPSDESLRNQLITKLEEKFNNEVCPKEVRINKICLLVKRRNDDRWKIEKAYCLRVIPDGR